MNYPFFQPMYGQGWPGVQQDSNHRFTPNEIPARIETALYLLRMLDHKEMQRAVASESQVVELDGMTLLPIEQRARAEAIALLERYFRGDLVPSAWEKSCDIPTPDNSEKIKPTQCPNCVGRPGDTSCNFCNGRGWSFVQTKTAE